MKTAEREKKLSGQKHLDMCSYYVICSALSWLLQIYNQNYNSIFLCIFNNYKHLNNLIGKQLL